LNPLVHHLLGLPDCHVVHTAIVSRISIDRIGAIPGNGYNSGATQFNRTRIMSSIWLSIFLLSLSNIFMTFAWYAHLKELNEKPWIIAALISWGIAFFEYILQVPANRIGHQVLSVAQLKILQEVITLTVFVPFAVFYLKERLKWDYVWAAVCILGAVYFIFRGNIPKRFL